MLELYFLYYYLISQKVDISRSTVRSKYQKLDKKDKTLDQLIMKIQLSQIKS